MEHGARPVNKIKFFVFPSALLLLVTGCAAPSIYSWGNYEPMVYAMYATPDKATVDLQIDAMEEDIQKARSAGKPLPPGFYAHLGYLYFQQGNSPLAQRAFESEKAAFPESSVLMDRMISSL